MSDIVEVDEVVDEVDFDRLQRLPMRADTALVYDAIFPAVLPWSEDEDYGMPELMLRIAEAAAAALRPFAVAPDTLS